jgi:hypothetical protein
VHGAKAVGIRKAPTQPKGKKRRRNSSDEEDEDESASNNLLDSEEEDLGRCHSLNSASIYYCLICLHLFRGIDSKNIISGGRPRRAAVRQTIQKMRTVIRLDEDDERISQDDHIPDRSEDSVDVPSRRTEGNEVSLYLWFCPRSISEVPLRKRMQRRGNVRFR